MTPTKPTHTPTSNTKPKLTSQPILRIASWEFTLWQLACMALLALITGLTIHWAFNNYERVTKTSYQMSHRAAFNPYYAAQLLIASAHNELNLDDNTFNNTNNTEADNDTEANNDIEFESDLAYANPYAQTLIDTDIKSLLDDLSELNNETTQSPQGSVLIIDSMSTKLSEERFANLQHWIEQGGHLITFAGRGVDESDFNDVLAYAKSLANTDSDVSNELQTVTWQYDEKLKTMMTELDVSNQFLAQLGIIAVTRSDTCDDCDNAEDAEDAEVEALLDKLEEDYGIQLDPNLDPNTETPTTVNGNDATSNDQTNTMPSPQDILKSRLNDLVESIRGEFSLVQVPITPAIETAALQIGGIQYSEPLLLEKRRFSDKINHDLFALQYPQTAKIATPTTSTIDTQAQQASVQTTHATIIRYYLQQELNRLTALAQTADQLVGDSQAHPASEEVTIAAHSKENESVAENNHSTVANPNQNDDMPLVGLTRLIPHLLSLDDATLSGLFAPASDLYVDIPLGQGRISVLQDSQAFRNPDPNLDLTTVSSLIEAGEKNDLDAMAAEMSSPLYAFIEPRWRYNLSSVDNSALLLALTTKAQKVWILPNNDIESLPTLLWRNAQLAIVGLALLLIIWLWSLYDRFGKKMTLSQTQSSNILTYFNQVGRYGWQFDRANTLLHQTRRQVRAQVYEHLPLLFDKPGKVHHRLPMKAVVMGQGDAAGSQRNTFAKAKIVANPLATLSQTEIETLSAVLVDLYERKRSTKSTLLHETVSNGSKLSSILYTSGTSWLTSDALAQALITPLAQSYSSQTLLEITQTLWCLNWLLKE